MGTSAVRYLDSAAGIVVLLLLAIAVVGGQTTSNSTPDAAPGLSTVALYPPIEMGTPDLGAHANGFSQRIANAELELPGADFVREFRLRNADDDRPVLLDD